MTPSPEAKRVPRLALFLVLALTAAACGSSRAAQSDDLSTDATSTTAPALSGEPVLDFYQCLRDNELDVADPTPGGPIGLDGIDLDDRTVMAVVEECAQTHLSSSDGRVSVGGNMGENMAEPAALLAFVDCMRDLGIDMPDPGPDGRMGLPDNVDPQATNFQSAVRSCAPLLDGGGILIGTPGGGGMVGRGGN